MNRINSLLKQIAGIVLVPVLFSCNDYLDREPLSQITPDYYLTEESQLASYINNIYPGILPSHESSVNWYGTFGWDNGTDNMIAKGDYTDYVPGELKTAQTGGDWEFTKIYQCNYFLQRVVDKWKSGEISGNDENVKHYIGEVYFLRAYEYFKKLQAFGDFPILYRPLPDEQEALTEASKRAPRNEVARFILADLDSAIVMLKEISPDGKKNRLSRNCANLVKSRVALFEGTWLKYFRNTPFVPDGNGWPGKQKDYNASYQYPSGSIDNEIDFFLGQAMEAAKAVADAVPLTENTGLLQQSTEEPANPYYNMYADENMAGYDEVLMWRQYDKGLQLTHGAVQFAQKGNAGYGLTRGMVSTFLMANGLPIYASGSGYAGDDYVADVRKNRDGRLWLFLKEPGQINVLYPSSDGTHATPVETVPDITSGNSDVYYSTGYAMRKGGNFDAKHCANFGSFTGSITFRAAEAYLNYLEACYERTGSIDGTAASYWRAIRTRAHLDTDYNKSISATNMSEEAKYNWGAYSAGQLVNTTLYNIRRERNCELMGEGLRKMDLKRWRAMDQLISSPYHIEGFKLWGPMQDWYKDESGASILAYGANDSKSNVSDPALSMYLRPQEVAANSLIMRQGGFKWAMAHYLSPIAIQNFLNTSADGSSVETSPIYQNPGWPTMPNLGAESL
ncbi:MAG: RagB/SusD family nutrient uptake outer membrane protein [Parabacteroides gordonii]|uniref:RagB/SusD family nutrient uptake outer membrane protein n=1 Tax=Parabacteroides gordonii TaxID=574930 RepID=UPI003A842F3F